MDFGFPEIIVRFIIDTDTPAQWISIESSDCAWHEDIFRLIRNVIPEENYNDLYKNAKAMHRGALTRLALTHNNQLATDFIPLFENSMASRNAITRQDALIGAGLVKDLRVIPIVKKYLEKESDAGTMAMAQGLLEQLLK